MVVSVLSTTSVRVVVQGWSVLSVTRIGVPGSRSFLGRLGNSRAFEAGAPLAVVELAGPPSAFFGSGSGASPADQRGSSALLPPSSSEPIARDDNTIAGRHAYQRERFPRRAPAGRLREGAKSYATMLWIGGVRQVAYPST